MTWRPIGWLLFAVCAVALFIAVFERDMSQGSLAALAETPLLRFDASVVTRLSVVTPDFKVECALRNGRWQMLQPTATRADASVVRKILDALRRSVRREVISPERQAQRGLAPSSFGLDAPRARVSVGTEQRQDEVVIGAAAPLSDQVYVMLEKGGDVIAASRDIEGAIPSGLDALKDRMVIPADFGKIVRVEVKHAGGFLQLAFRGGEWRLQQPQEAPADGAAVERLIGVLRGLRVEQFVAESSFSDPVAYGMGREDAVVEISAWQDGRAGRVDLTVGKAKEDSPGLVYARIGDIGGVCLLRKEAVDRLAVPADSLRDRRLCDATPSSVQSLILRDGEKKLVFRRQAAEEWMITDPVRARADAGMVGRILRQLGTVAADPLSGMAATNAMAHMATSAVWRIMLSTAPPAGGATNAPAAEPPAAGRTWSYGIARETADGWRTVIHEEARQALRVRAGDFPGGLWSEGAGSPAEALSYMDRRVFYVDLASIRRFTTAGGGVEESVVRDASGRWTAESPPEAKVLDESVSDLMRMLNEVRAVRIESTTTGDLSAYGLADRSSRLTIGLAGAGGIQKTLVFGSATPDGHVYAAIQGQDVLFVLRRETVAALTRKLVVEP